MSQPIYRIVFGMALLAAPLAVGGVHTEVVIGLAVLCAVALGLQYTHFRREYDSRANVFSVPSIAFWGLAVISLLQLIPLPGGLNAVVSPQGHAWFEGGWEAMFGQSAPSRWRATTLDVRETADRALRWLTLGLGAAVASNEARLKKGASRMVWLVVASGAAMIVVGLLQWVTASQQVLFVYEPTAEFVRWGTFVSDNHASLFTGMVALAAFGLAFRHGRKEGMWAAGAALVGILSMVMMLEFDSAGGTAFFFMALGLFVILTAFSRRLNHTVDVSEGARRGLVGLGVVLLLAPLVLAGLLLWGPSAIREPLWAMTVGRWGEGNLSARPELIEAGLRGAADFPLFGAGAGAVERALPAYVDWSAVRPATIPTIENESVQWLFEFGLPAGVAANLLIFGYLGFGLSRFRRRARWRYAMGISAAALLLMGAQVHFPFLALGISLPAVVLVESCLFPVGSTAEEMTSLEQVRRRGLLKLSADLTRWVPYAAFAAAVVAGGVWLAADVEVRQLEVPEEPEARRAMFEGMVAAIPSDGELYLKAASVAAREEQFERAVERVTFAHRVEPKANMLVAMGQIQAAAGDEEAAADSFRRLVSGAYLDVPPEWIRRDLTAVIDDPERLADILDEADPEFWRAAARGLRDRIGPATASEFLLEIIDAHPDHPRPYELMILNFLRMRQGMLAEMWARRLIEKSVDDAQGRRVGWALLLKALRVQKSRRDEARQTAVQALQAAPEDPQVKREIVHLAPTDPGRADGAFVAAVGRATDGLCDHPAGRRDTELCWRGRAWLQERNGRYESARYAYRRLAFRAEQPRSLAAFYVRREKCVQLKNFVAEWSERFEGVKKQRANLEVFVERCRAAD